MKTRYFMREYKNPNTQVVYWYWTKHNGLRRRYLDGKSTKCIYTIAAFRRFSPPVHEVLNPVANEIVFIHRGYQIKAKKDFPAGGMLCNGKRITKGWVVVKDDCNIMPGATWFETILDAKKAINVLIRVKGDAERFWEIMQPFKFTRLGQRADFENGSVRKGRFEAIIKNWKVVQLRSDLLA